jgi:hypothetical protein
MLAMTTRVTVTVSQTSPTIAKGPIKRMVPRQNLPLGLEPPRENRARDKATQGVASSWHFLGPHRGDMAPSSFVSESRSGGFLHAPPRGLSPIHPGFPATDYSGKMLETTWPGFGRGEGGIIPYLILWLALTLEW